jgi:predicted RNA binding protein YcfA (HicA-like mRNA interferase family)
VSFDDLAKLLKWHGFELRRVKGSHHIFKRGSSSIIVVYRKSHVHPKAVKETLALIDALGEDM